MQSFREYVTIQESTYQKPPNLRESTYKTKCCGHCAYFQPQNQSCGMFGSYPVKSNQICDEFVGGEPGTKKD